MTLLLAFTIALCTSLLLTPVARTVAQRLGVVDSPDGQRKLQATPVPLWGGVAVYCGLCAGLAAAMLVRVPGQPIPARLPLLLTISGGLLGLVGLVDDAHNLRARTKLLLQICAVSPLVMAGFFPLRVILLGAELSLGWLGPVVMLFWLVACVNALNLLDGLDGFASVVGITVAAGVAAVGLLSGNFAAAVAAVALAGGILGFLPFNLPPASIYLGDAGSMMIGLTLGALCMQATDITGETFVAVVPLAIMSVPLWDTIMAVVRRRLRGMPIGEGDRAHLQHRLITRGLTIPQALCFVSFLCLTAGGAVVLGIRAGWELLAPLGAVAIVGVLAATQTFGQHELGLLRRVAAAWTVSSLAPLALPMRYQGVKLKRLLVRLDLNGAWALFIQILDLLECHSAELAFSDDCRIAPRSYRLEDHDTANSQYGECESVLVVAVGSMYGPKCELRVTYRQSGDRHIFHAACLADVLHVFAASFLRLAMTGASLPVLHVVSDAHGPGATARRAA
jgi:UDP-GlcNAc:undecaprenyl-phosphate GlcNAc-1-phosphate transferase